jgi:hypothetical protein
MNDGRFSDGSAVLVRYPRNGPQSAVERAQWPWLPATVEQQCGPGEWLVTIEARRMAVLEDGSPAPDGTPDGDLFWPQCCRDSSKIRAVPGPEARLPS